MVEIRDYFFTSILPFVPVQPDERSVVTLFFEKLYTVVELTHTFRYMLGSLGCS